MHNIPGVGADYLDVVLKPFGDFHEPHIGDSKICVHMVKITGIPINFMQTILEAIKKLNYLNMFYVWSGTKTVSDIDVGDTVPQEKPKDPYDSRPKILTTEISMIY